MKKLSVLLFSLTLVLCSCDGQYDALVDERLKENPVPGSEPVSAGDADFRTFVAIGNSLTAGFMDAALYNLGQQNSMPALLYGALAEAGGQSQFTQPDINSETGFNTSVENPQNGMVLGRFKLDTSIPGPSPVLDGDQIQPYNGDTSSLNNFGVPGIVAGQLLTPATATPGSPAFNPFYARFASNPGSSTILGDALATQPTFFTLWIGNNDVLGYALGGASNPAILTSTQAFDAQFNTIIDNIISNSSAQGVVGTIPPLLAIPYFQAVSYNAVTLGSEQSQQLNQALAGVNAALQAVADNFPQHSQNDIEARKIRYQAGANSILVNDPELDDFEDEFDRLQMAGAISMQQRQALVPYEQSRPLRQGELVTLRAGSLIGTQADPSSPRPTTVGVVIPLGWRSAANGDEFFLTVGEQAEIQQRTLAFNTIIATAVAQNSDRLALYDANAGFPGNPNSTLGAFADLFGVDGELGIRVEDGTLLQPDFSPNGVFSTDGVHPNPRGNALVANEILQVIENAFGARLPRVDVLNLPSVQLCAGDCVSNQN